jgi:hypothetical protein
MPIPTGRLTFQQIRDLAVRQAGNPQLGQPLTTGPSPATLFLVQILYDLHTQYEWPFDFKSTTLLLTTDTFDLPADFYESQDDNALIVLQSNGMQQAQIVQEVAADEFYGMAATQAIGTIPLFWTVDRENYQGKLFPNCVGNSSTAQFRYRAIPPAETTPPAPQATPEAWIAAGAETAINAVVPVFPWSRYLIQALYVDCLQYERDPRYDLEVQKLEFQKKQVLQGSAVFRASSATIPLDPDVFRKPFRNDAYGPG